MKKLLFALILIFVLDSCKKDKTQITFQPPAGVEKNVKTIKSNYDNYPAEITSLFYDSKNRLTLEKEEYTGMVSTTTFDYNTPEKIIRTRTDNDKLIHTTECKLNNDGFINEMKIVMADGSVLYTYKLTYDANGYLEKKEWTNSSGVTDHFEYKVEIAM